MLLLYGALLLSFCGYGQNISSSQDVLGDWYGQVDADQNLPAIKKALERGGNEQITIKKLDSLNHLFQKSETGAVQEYAEIEQTFLSKASKLSKTGF